MRLPPSRREAEELGRLKDEFDGLIDRVACLEIELAEANDRVLRFIADYHARLGPLLAQIAILEAEVGRSRGQIEEILNRAEEAAT